MGLRVKVSESFIRMTLEDIIFQTYTLSQDVAFTSDIEISVLRQGYSQVRTTRLFNDEFFNVLYKKVSLSNL